MYHIVTDFQIIKAGNLLSMVSGTFFLLFLFCTKDIGFGQYHKPNHGILKAPDHVTISSQYLTV